MRFCLSTLLILTTILFSFGQEDQLWLNPNKGQWDSRIDYKVKADGGEVLIENQGLTYLFHDAGHSHEGGAKHVESVKVNFHAVRSTFLNANTVASVEETNRSNFYSNYFCGTDKSQWKSFVYSFQNIQYLEYYPGIDFLLQTTNAQLEYQFLLKPGSDVSLIQRHFEGMDKISVESNGDLLIRTSLGEVRETKPRAFEISEEGRNEVRCEYKLRKGVLSFHFPDGYNSSKTLLIDPSLTFSSFTGSTADNWGMTAAPGPNGELIGGGIVFGAGYPITAGAFDNSYNGGDPLSVGNGFDIGITKYTPTGNQLIFSTYLGGNRNELPQSIVSTTNGDIYILGITSSANFPITNGAYDNSFAGGTTQSSSGLQFGGTDLFVVKFNAVGTQLMASTYIGGSANDGFNMGALQYNYGDGFRGDIILDGNDNVYVATNSSSSNFPTTTGGALQGAQDAVVFKMNSNLTSLIWSRYLGGIGVECANSLILSNDNRLYVAGGTTSAAFQGLTNTHSGAQDGFLMELNPTDGSTLNGRFVGTSSYDQVYFVQTDIDNMVYIFGQSNGPIPITAGKFNNGGGGQFIQKYNPQLALQWSTKIGGTNGQAQISPTAFLISDCYDIFFSGWGGQINLSSMATSSTTYNFPLTADAFQSVTNGSNFYLGILGQDANNLVYGTYMGGMTSSSNHVDGGTSRFDKSGAVYHAVCAACAGSAYGFTTTPGSFATANPSPNCNMAVFKFQLGLPYSLSPNQEMCNGGTYQLNASGGVSYSWTPTTGLNNPNIPNPLASPSVTTVYYVNMDFNEGCSITDSVVVTVVNRPAVELESTVTICTNDSRTITASGGDMYVWSPNIEISATNTQTVVVNPSVSRYYYVNVSNDCFTTRDSIWVNVRPLPEIILTQDTMICRGDAVVLTPLGVNNIAWTPHSTLTVIDGNRASVRPITERYYFVTGTDDFGCSSRDSVQILFHPIPPYTITPDTSICLGSNIDLEVVGEIDPNWQANVFTPQINQPLINVAPTQNTSFYVDLTYDECVLTDSVRIKIIYLPSPSLSDSLVVCENIPLSITASGADTYNWVPANNLNQSTGSTVIFQGHEDQSIQVAFTNICGTVYETVFIDVINPYVKAYGDTIICPGETAFIWAEGALSYRWEPTAGLNVSIASSALANPVTSTLYYVYGKDQFGCIAKDSVYVEHFPQPIIHAGADQHVLSGDEVTLTAIFNNPGMVSWSPTEFLSCIDCESTISRPDREMTYTVMLIDTNGCIARDAVQILFTPLIYIPNTFTPDTDGNNDVFRVVAGNISSIEILIFNRWGELIYQSDDMTVGWNGTYKGVNCPDGTYTWKLNYTDLKGNNGEMVGHVNVLR